LSFMLGHTVFRYETLPSTNDTAREMALRGADEGTIVLAGAQTAGRGRLGRTWSSPAGEGLYLSLVLRPQIETARAAAITLGAAVAVAETLIDDFMLTADIKWPNDVLVGCRKICGILLEAASESGRLQYAILGIGVNLNQKDFPEDISQVATSICRETGRMVSADDFLAPLLGRLGLWYETSLLVTENVVGRWQELSSSSRGCRVRIQSPDGDFDAVTCGLASTGALRVELETGQVRELFSGEVTLRKG
jgi:BirA family transcriptional regulator, biotin operon repressor / biotin---[acetyl-CoA-carboxylase] ligase